VIGFLSVRHGANIQAYVDDHKFRIQLPEFAELVTQARTSATNPVRLFLSEEDRSIWYTASIFVLTVYDETDEADRGLS